MDDTGTRTERLTRHVADTVTVEITPYMNDVKCNPAVLKVGCTEIGPGQFIFELRHRIVFSTPDMEVDVGEEAESNGDQGS